MEKEEKIKEENNEENLMEKNKSERENSLYKEGKTLIWIAIVLLICFFSFYYFFKSFNNFEYKGMQFTRQKIGEAHYFQYYYYFPDSLGNPVEYRLNLRIDPRENNVPVTGNIRLKKDKILYFGANETGFEECPSDEKAIAVSSFVLFLNGNGMNVKVFSPDKNVAVEKNITHATCEKYFDNSVILIQNNKETRINASGNCFVIDINNCQFLSALEKFEVEFLAQAKERGFF